MQQFYDHDPSRDGMTINRMLQSRRDIDGIIIRSRELIVKARETLLAADRLLERYRLLDVWRSDEADSERDKMTAATSCGVPE